MISFCLSQKFSYAIMMMAILSINQKKYEKNQKRSWNGLYKNRFVETVDRLIGGRW